MPLQVGVSSELHSSLDSRPGDSSWPLQNGSKKLFLPVRQKVRHNTWQVCGHDGPQRLPMAEPLISWYVSPPHSFILPISSSFWLSWNLRASRGVHILKPVLICGFLGSELSLSTSRQQKQCLSTEDRQWGHLNMEKRSRIQLQHYMSISPSGGNPEIMSDWFLGCNWGLFLLSGRIHRRAVARDTNCIVQSIEQINMYWLYRSHFGSEVAQQGRTLTPNMVFLEIYWLFMLNPSVSASSALTSTVYIA